MGGLGKQHFPWRGADGDLWWKSTDASAGKREHRMCKDLSSASQACPTPMYPSGQHVATHCPVLCSIVAITWVSLASSMAQRNSRTPDCWELDPSSFLAPLPRQQPGTLSETHWHQHQEAKGLREFTRNDQEGFWLWSMVQSHHETYPGPLDRRD